MQPEKKVTRVSSGSFSLSTRDTIAESIYESEPLGHANASINVVTVVSVSDRDDTEKLLFDLNKRLAGDVKEDLTLTSARHENSAAG